VSGFTTLLTPWLIRAAGPTAAWVDKKLPRALQTFSALYSSWLEQLRAGPADVKSARNRRAIRWLIVDAVMVAVIVIGASVEMDRIATFAQKGLNLPENWTRLTVIVGGALAAGPFAIGLVQSARALGFDLANRAFPTVAGENVDLAAAPRRLLVVTLQLAILLLVGVPLIAITQPFLPPFRGAAVLLLFVVLLAIAFWRGAANFQGHARAAAQALAEALARQTKKGRELGSSHWLDGANRVLTGLGSPVPVEVPQGSRVVGKTLAQIQLRGLTGATVLAIQRGDQSILIPAGQELLREGDILAIAGSHDSVEAARKLVGEQPG
jgi:CPA2 family monovalent cation:H+ antiporter-2